MIVGALAGILSLSDYRVDIDAVVSVRAPDPIAHQQTAWLTDQAREQRRSNRQSERAQSAERVARAERRSARTERSAVTAALVACDPQAAIATAEPIEDGLCIVPEPADATVGARHIETAESLEPMVVVEAAPVASSAVGEPAGPDLPLGVAIARGHVESDDLVVFEHWPGASEIDRLAAPPDGPQIPEALVLARANDRRSAEAARRMEARLSARARAAEQEWLVEHRRFFDEGMIAAEQFTERALEKSEAQARDLEQADEDAAAVMLDMMLEAKAAGQARMRALIEEEVLAAESMLNAKRDADARAEQQAREAMAAQAQAALELAEAKLKADAEADAAERALIAADAEAALALLDAKAKADALAEQKAREESARVEQEAREESARVEQEARELAEAKARADEEAAAQAQVLAEREAQAALELAKAKAQADARAEAAALAAMEEEAEAARLLAEAKANAAAEAAAAQQALIDADADAAREMAEAKAAADVQAHERMLALIDEDASAARAMEAARARAQQAEHEQLARVEQEAREARERAERRARDLMEADALAAAEMRRAKQLADERAAAAALALAEADAEASALMDSTRAQAIEAHAAQLALDVGPPLPSFLEICRARFEDPLGLGDQTLWTSVDAAAQPEDEEMTVYVTADGTEVDYDPEEGRVLPFDPLTVTPFDEEGESKTRQAFEEVLAADDGLHTVRYIKELTHELRAGETLSQVLSAAGLSAAEVDRWVRATQKVYDSNRVFPGQEIRLTVDMPSRVLKGVQLDSGRDALIIVESDGERVIARREDIIYERGLRVVEATIDSSLYVSAMDKRIPDRIISEMAEILGWDINFGRDLRAGSSFRAIYEQLTRVDSAETISGRVLAVEVSNRGKLHEGFYFERGEHGVGGYYDRNGDSLGRKFLRFPVSYSRVSSPFSTARYHPVLKRRIPHYGVDFAAPTGTPVRAVADGKVLKSGWYGGNGRFVKIRHDTEYESGYAHLSRIASGVSANATVKKGEVIGYVGSTGLATGPHLHFAMYQKGKYIDPMNAELPRDRALAGRELTGFKMKVAMMDRAYAELGDGADRSTQVAAAEAPAGDTH